MENKNNFKGVRRFFFRLFFFLWIMKNKRRFGRFMRFFIGLFVLLFVVRLGYGFYTTPNRVVEQTQSDAYRNINEDSFRTSKKNYASDSYKYKAAPSVAIMPQMSQKYEKTADVVSGSTRFEDDDRKIRGMIEAHNGIIQYENKSGLEGARVLLLLIGVPPSKFDDFYLALQKIGTVKSQNITKTDKTNDFLNLKAQRASLESTLKTLVELKKQNGRIGEFISLQEKILEIEKKLLELGVMLGEYDEVNEFCSVRLVLNENRVLLIYPPRVIKRLMIAFNWTVKVYLAISLALFFGALAIQVIMLILDRTLLWLRIFRR